MKNKLLVGIVQGAGKKIEPGPCMLISMKYFSQYPVPAHKGTNVKGRHFMGEMQKHYYADVY